MLDFDKAGGLIATITPERRHQRVRRDRVVIVTGNDMNG